MEEAEQDAIESLENKNKTEMAVEKAKEKEAQRVQNARVLRNEELTETLFDRNLVFVFIDGPTDSKNTFNGVIGKLLPKVEELEFNPRFRKITAGPDLPTIHEEVANDLSSAQRLLLLDHQSLRTGIVKK